MSSTNHLSPDRLARLHDILEGHVERGTVPGLVAVISRRGQVHVETIGTTTVEGSTAVEEDTIFRISSMTKPITAVATLLLVEECVLRLDDPVETFLPELADRQVLQRIDGPLEETVPAVRPITLRHLLTFTFGSGADFAPSPFNDMAASLQLGVGPPQPQLVPDPDEWMRRFSTLPLMCQPGERWLYHTGAEILGVLIARASGQSFERFLKERVFEPLGMVDTAFAVPPENLGRFTAGYFTNPVSGDFDLFDEVDGQWSTPPAFASGAAGLVSTGPDFLAFAEMLLRGGAPLLARSSVEVMTTDHLTPAQKAISGFVPGEFDAKGFGFCVSVVTRHDHPAAPVGQYGWDGGLGSIWRNDHAEQLSCILLTNAAWSAPQAPPVAQDFLTAAYAAIVN